jgi:hypothetical protein
MPGKKQKKKQAKKSDPPSAQAPTANDSSTASASPTKPTRKTIEVFKEFIDETVIPQIEKHLGLDGDPRDFIAHATRIRDLVANTPCRPVTDLEGLLITHFFRYSITFLQHPAKDHDELHTLRETMKDKLLHCSRDFGETDARLTKVFKVPDFKDRERYRPFVDALIREHNRWNDAEYSAKTAMASTPQPKASPPPLISSKEEQKHAEEEGKEEESQLEARLKNSEKRAETWHERYNILRQANKDLEEKLKISEEKLKAT